MKQKPDTWWDGSRDGAVNELYSPVGHLVLPFGPLSSVTGVYTYDDDNTENTFSSSAYYIDTAAPQGRVSLKSGSVWPSTVLRPSNGIRVRGVFGYGATAASVPNDLVLAVMTLAARMYEHRGDELPEIPPQVMTLLSAYEQVRI
jgi:uncharacterized phiE125 gp8 family phage protein